MAASNLSPAARERLEDELARLREQRSSQALNLREEDPVGDSADQAGLLERAETTAWIDRRIREITDMLTHGESPEAAARREGQLPDGTTVKLRFSDGEEETMRVVAFADETTEDDVTALTADSPLGRALIGKSKGDTITYRTPRGEQSAKVLSLNLPR
ncbi:GreA/GreB family elongation factor [Amycolatopsis suaedae]|uniref:Nucleoside diphosphate kinase regulator n=1 Tax=Amycolatopsis suaedae TaxID=2510978 RepID=A0A4Q7JE32_9PSEU|nr:GreA/GreB family elongation factor [Amycolatopsis suaedae]RZQ65352.1 nucleoside diphosphate kinase regulator [Amycolatopsis suaedae]